jgi:hypothetical protein
MVSLYKTSRIYLRILNDLRGRRLLGTRPNTVGIQRKNMKRLLKFQNGTCTGVIKNVYINLNHLKHLNLIVKKEIDEVFKALII